MAFLQKAVAKYNNREDLIAATHKFISDQAFRTKSANCCELSTYAFFDLLKMGYQGKLEYVAFTARDHEFLVLNRKEGSDKSDWKTWGDDAIILDPWLNMVFTAKEFGEIWREKIHLVPPRPRQGLAPGPDPLEVDTIEKLLETRVKFDRNTFEPPAATSSHTYGL